jgi:hypothetical protein
MILQKSTRAILGVIAVGSFTIHAQSASASKGDGIGKPKYSVGSSVTNFSAKAVTIPYFRSRFTDPTNGYVFAYTMVGTDPANGDQTTTLPTVIIPFRLTFASSVDP